jgi:predicted phage terminase large subunit-like protein
MPAAVATLDRKQPTAATVADELRQIQLELARRTNLEFTRFTMPDFEVNWHHRLVAQKLDDVLNGKIKRLMIFEPPQNGKTEQVSRRFPAFTLGRFPNKRIIACSYGLSLAQDISRDVQKIMMTPEYRELFPKTRLAGTRDEEKRTQSQFDIVGKRGRYLGVGIEGGVTGKTADIGIIDDPIKNREEAESETYRDKVWDFYKSAFETRQFGDAGAIIICLTRWHQDDLAGRLLKLAEENTDAAKWDVVLLPAIAEHPVADYDPRSVGDPLWPAKYPLSNLKQRRATQGEYDWASLYQGQPKPAEGGLFKKIWFADKIVDAAPTLARRARGWDTAGTEKDGDYTCGVKISEAVKKNPETGALEGSGIFYVENVVREQLGPNGVDNLIKVTAQLDGVECAQREEKEGGASGLAVIEARTKSLKGHDYKGVTVTGSKITRSKPFRAQCEAGNVFIVRGPWNKDYLDELCDFPGGDHDDQVDGSSCAFNSVLLEPIPEPEFVTW